MRSLHAGIPLPVRETAPRNADPSAELCRDCHWGWQGTGPWAGVAPFSLYPVSWVPLANYSRGSPGAWDLQHQAKVLLISWELSSVGPVQPHHEETLPAVPEIRAAKFLNTVAYEGQNQRSQALPTRLPTGLERHSPSA